MRAVGVFPEERSVRLIDHPEPNITAPNQVKIRMLEVGVCGTDKAICSFEFGTPPPGSDYFVLGHESLGEVVETGSAVERVKPGDLVVSVVRHPCRNERCTPCRAGRQDFCITGEYQERGIRDLHGFMTEFIVDEERYVNVLPGELRDVGMLIEPLTIAEKTLLEVTAIQRRLPWAHGRQRAVVLGAGPVGLLGAMVLVQAGYETYVYSRSPKPNPKAAVAEAIGATYVSSEIEPPENLAERVGEIDLVYEAMGAAQPAFDVLNFLGANGVFVLTGVPERDRHVRIDTDRLLLNMVLKNQIVMGTINAGPDAFEAAIRDLGAFLRRWPEAVRSLITGYYPLEAFEEPVSGKAGGIKNVISIWR